MDTQPDTNSRLSSRSFLGVVRPIIVLNKFSSVAPLVIRVDSSDNCTIEFSLRVSVCSYVVHLIIFIISVVFVALDDESTNEKIFYSFGRLFLSFVIQATCLHNHQLILEGLKLTTDLGVSMPKWYTIRLVYILLPIAGTIAFMEARMFYSTFMIPIGVIKDCLPVFVLVSICGLFGCQVVALKMSIAELNQEILNTVVNESAIPEDGGNLKEIMLRHNKLWELCSILNEAYGVPMFVATSAIFCEATFCIFFFCKYFGTSTQKYSVIATTVWFIICIAPSVFTIYNCQQTENMSRETRLISKRITTERFQTLVKHSHNKISEFELQLSQQKIKFSACGFFDLNGAQIKTVASTIVIYVVILLQTE